jgi:hypothetical protein
VFASGARQPSLRQSWLIAAALPSHRQRRWKEHNVTENDFRSACTTKHKVSDDDDLLEKQSIASTSQASDHSSKSSFSDGPSTKRNLPVGRRIQEATGDFISALGFLSSSITALLYDRSLLQRHRPSIEALRQFLKTSGIDLELSRSLSARFANDIVVLGRIQQELLKGKDRRDLALSTKNVSLPTKEESLRYVYPY